MTPQVDTTREFLAELDSGRYDELKERPVITYCTGGIRCEVLSALMINRGFREVYQIDGGIARYAESFGDDGLWDGSLYVFDKRMTIEFSDHSRAVGECVICQEATSHLIDCAHDGCDVLQIVCESCAATPLCAAHR